jgi:hypothetical protein
VIRKGKKFGRGSVVYDTISINFYES